MYVRFLFLQGPYEIHDNRGTFFGECAFFVFVFAMHRGTLSFAVVNDRDQGKNEAVENATYKVGDNLEHYELLELYSMKKRYTIRE